MQLLLLVEAEECLCVCGRIEGKVTCPEGKADCDLFVGASPLREFAPNVLERALVSDDDGRKKNGARAGSEARLVERVRLARVPKRALSSIM
eukprot:210065-Pyramimonas_sp.AAC.1